MNDKGHWPKTTPLKKKDIEVIFIGTNEAELPAAIQWLGAQGTALWLQNQRSIAFNAVSGVNNFFLINW
jgi:hypothetical protein